MKINKVEVTHQEYNEKEFCGGISFQVDLAGLKAIRDIPEKDRNENDEKFVVYSDNILEDKEIVLDDISEMFWRQERFGACIKEKYYIFEL